MTLVVGQWQWVGFVLFAGIVEACERVGFVEGCAGVVHPRATLLALGLVVVVVIPCGVVGVVAGVVNVVVVIGVVFVAIGVSAGAGAVFPAVGVVVAFVDAVDES